MTPSSSRTTDAGGISWLPDDARVVALVRAAGADWSPAAAIELADLIGRRRPRTILASVVPGDRGPDKLLGASERPGISAALSGTATVAGIAITPAGCSFTYLPAGRPSVPYGRLAATASFRHLVQMVPRGGGTLLLFLTEADMDFPVGSDASIGAAGIDGWVPLGPVDSAMLESVEARILARVEHPLESSRGGDSAARPPARASALAVPAFPDTPGARSEGRAGPRAAVRRLKKRGGLARARATLIIWGTAVAVVWLVWQGISGWPVFQEEYSDSAPAGEPDIAAAEPAGLPEEGPREAPGERAASLESDSTVPRTFVGAELPYSILMASYVDREDAEGQRRTLEDDGGLYLVAPTLIRGRLYFRVFAGAMADRFHAEELMRELVASGRKERARDWDMRPANLTFDLGTFASEDDATEVRDRLHEMHLPAYVLTDGAVPAPAYKVYSGAFETEEAAAVLDSLLRSSAQDAILVVRRGESR